MRNIFKKQGLQSRIIFLYHDLDMAILKDSVYIQCKRAYEDMPIKLKKFRKAKRIYNKLIELGEPMDKVNNFLLTCLPKRKDLIHY